LKTAKGEAVQENNDEQEQGGNGAAPKAAVKKSVPAKTARPNKEDYRLAAPLSPSY
jgi:hypothetical protein